MSEDFAPTQKQIDLLESLARKTNVPVADATRAALAIVGHEMPSTQSEAAWVIDWYKEKHPESWQRDGGGDGPPSEKSRNLMYLLIRQRYGRKPDIPAVIQEAIGKPEVETQADCSQVIRFLKGEKGGEEFA